MLRGCNGHGQGRDWERAVIEVGCFAQIWMVDLRAWLYAITYEFFQVQTVRHKSILGQSELVAGCV